jgi:hypothetical protein
VSNFATLNAQITVAPGPVYDGTCPPVVLSTVGMLQFTPEQKPATVGTGVNTRAVNSPSAFVSLGDITMVAAASLLYVRSSNVVTAVQLRLTFGASQAVIPLAGLLLLELDPVNPLTLLEVQGVGTLEYLVTGAS